MGSNVGLSTPYFEILPPWTPDPEYPMLLQMFEDAPMYVNGQRMTCSLDGFNIGCGRAMDMLETGSAIPAALAQYQNMPGFRFNSHGLGIYTYDVPRQVGWNVTHGPNDGPTGTANPVYRGHTTHSFSLQMFTWAPQRQTQTLASLPEKRNNAIGNALKEMTDFLKKGKFSEDCQKNVIDKLNGIPDFSLEKFIAFLELGGDFYDGTKSTALAKQYNPAYPFGPTTTIADSFKTRGTTQTNARTANGINSRFTVFFRPDEIETGKKKSRLTGAKISGITNDNLAFIFHEGLHGFGHYSGNNSLYDGDLQKAFGLTVGAASINISEHIKKNCLEHTD